MLIEIRDDGRVNPFNELEGDISYGQFIYDSLYNYGTREETDPVTFITTEVQYIDNRIDNVLGTIETMGNVLIICITLITLVIVSKYFVEGR